MASKTKRSAPIRRTRKKRRTRSKRAKPSFKSRALQVLNEQNNSTVKYHAFFSTAQFQIPTKTLWYQELSQIPRQSTTVPNAINRRERDIIHVCGARIRMTFRNEILTPLVVNVAIVIPNKVETLNTASLNTQFFRSCGVVASDLTVDRNISFDDYTALSGIQYNTLPINTDRHSVVWHARFKLGVINTNGGFSSGELKNYRSISRYVRINKNLAYNAEASTTASERLLLLVWTSSIFEVNGNPVDNALEFQANNSLIFRDID